LNTPISKVDDLLPKPLPVDYDAELKRRGEGLPREDYRKLEKEMKAKKRI